MSRDETAALGLPLLAAGQAQKHVTVNEALTRLDAVAAGRVAGVGADTPPVAAVEGEAHVVGTAPSGDWSGRAGALAYRVGGGWDFVAPWAGAGVHDVASGGRVVFDGVDWVEGRIAGSASGAATAMRVVEIEHAVEAGAVSDTATLIPEGALAIGVTGRVVEAIGGVSGWRLGIEGAEERYGAGLGTAAGAYARGLTSAPLVYWQPTALRLTPEEGAFTSGRVLLAVHLIEIRPPRVPSMP
ncbi:MAG: DUF2793 domain-containing protein [Paracoccaceae bacterium]